MALERMPIYAKTGTTIPVYPEVVQGTDEMALNRVVRLRFDDSCGGVSNPILGKVTRL